MDSPQKITKEFEGYTYNPSIGQTKAGKDWWERLDYLGYMSAVYNLARELKGD
ncbi:hypothetical protein GKC32_00625 [Lactobacillus curvatus]|nr:hypothetical protein [Latilactobacillus curvatus]MSE22979.1 hypothetical protein [Latilactobacillus curvatus]